MGSSNNVINDYIAGALGGAAGLVVGHPFDTTKVQLQTQHASRPYKGTLDAIKNINNTGWSKGFFRGLGFPLVSYGVVNSVFFGVYGNTLSYMAQGKLAPSNVDIFTAGCVGGAIQLIVACPVDVVKVVLQSQISRNGTGATGASSYRYFTGPRQCIAWIVKTQGVQGLYKGLKAMAYRDVASYGLYMLVYERMYEFLHNKQWFDQHGAVASMLAGGTTGVITWASVIPFDCIKSRLQADQAGRYTGMLDCATDMYRQSGYRVFFSGLLINSIRSFPVNAITFLIYSQVLKSLNGDGQAETV